MIKTPGANRTDTTQLAEIISLGDAKLYYFKTFFQAESTALFHRLREVLDWRQDRISLYGRELPIPRLQAWYGDKGLSYSYSGLTLQAAGWLPELLEIRTQLSAAFAQIPIVQTNFNAVLANLYRDGNDSVGWHSDDEPELGSDPIIASVSLGAERRFVLQHKRNKTVPRKELLLQDGSLLIMGPGVQQYWRHQLPKTKRVCAERINLTYRYLMAAP